MQEVLCGVEKDRLELGKEKPVCPGGGGAAVLHTMVRIGLLGTMIFEER